MQIIKNSLGKLAMVSTLMLTTSGVVWAAEGTHGGNICSLSNGDFCYSSDGLYPSGTNICDTWETDGSCSMNGISGGHGGGIKAKKLQKFEPASPPPGTSPARKDSARQQR